MNDSEKRQEQSPAHEMSEFGAFLFGMMSDMNREFARQFSAPEKTKDGEVAAVNL